VFWPYLTGRTSLEDRQEYDPAILGGA